MPSSSARKLTRCCNERPSRSTDHAATTSIEQGSDLPPAVPHGRRYTAHDRRRSQAPRRAHWRHRRAPQLGLGNDPEPSLMMPGIIISLIFREQGKLVLRATPLQNQLASAPEAANNLANGFGIQLTAANFPRCPRRYLFAPQQTGLDQPFDRAVADATYSRSLAQTNSFRIRRARF